MGTRGVYLSRDGVLELVVDNRTPIPGGDPGDTFETDVAHSVRGSVVAFKGWNTSFSDRQGLYLWADGDFVIVADQTMLVPGGRPGEHYSSFGLPWVGPGGTVTFSGRGDGVGFGTRGIYRWRDGDFEVLVDSSTVAPGAGGGTFLTVCCSYADREDVIFKGFTADFRGVFKRVGGLLTLVLETGSIARSLVNGTAYYTGFGPDGGRGIYREVNHVITAIADETTPTPPGGPPGTTLCCFRGPGASELGVAFRAYSTPSSPSNPAMYWWSNGSIWRIIGDGDVLDGRQILGVYVTHDGVSGNLLPFTVVYTDFQHAVYVVEVRIPSVLEVPTLSPAAVAVLVALLALAGSWLVRRRCVSPVLPRR